MISYRLLIVMFVCPDEKCTYCTVPVCMSYSYSYSMYIGLVYAAAAGGWMDGWMDDASILSWWMSYGWCLLIIIWKSWQNALWGPLHNASSKIDYYVFRGSTSCPSSSSIDNKKEEGKKKERKQSKVPSLAIMYGTTVVWWWLFSSSWLLKK